VTGADAGGGDPTPGELLELAREVAREAAGVLLGAVQRQDLHIAHKSSATDLVTEIDQQVERLIIERILARRPHDGVLGEEGGGRAGRSGVRWVIDPIDGTTNFVYRIPAFAVSIAAEVRGSTQAGVVAVPGFGELFEASAGGGARCNGVPIACSTKAELPTALIATGFSYQPARRVEQGAALARLLGRVRDVRRLGAAAVDLCSVACGRVDGYYESGLNAWDFAAGALIAAEAGALVTDLRGGPPSGSFTVAAPPSLHGMLVDLLIATGA
jgi:myo-inositol-1(or 4)-monophosphatase